RVEEIGVGNRATLLQNVAAVLAYVNVGQPQASPLLANALTVHWARKVVRGERVVTEIEPGDPSQPTFRDQNAPAYRAIADWVRLGAATSPHLAEQAPPRPATTADVRPTPVWNGMTETLPTPKTVTPFAQSEEPKPQPTPMAQAERPKPIALPDSGSAPD